MCALSAMLVSSNKEDWTIKGIGNGDDELTNVVAVHEGPKINQGHSNFSYPSGSMVRVQSQQ